MKLLFFFQIQSELGLPGVLFSDADAYAPLKLCKNFKQISKLAVINIGFQTCSRKEFTRITPQKMLLEVKDEVMLSITY